MDFIARKAEDADSQASDDPYGLDQGAAVRDPADGENITREEFEFKSVMQ